MNDATLVTTLGRDPHAHHGIVNPPQYRASTILSPTLEAYDTRPPGPGAYGRYGTPTTFALQDAVAALEGGDGCIAVGSGGTAIAATLLTLLSAGDHLVLADSVYAPTRRLADGLLRRMGVTSSYVDPRRSEDLRATIPEACKVVFVESPGSLTFEVQDVAAIAEAAHARGALVVADCTWASPLYFKPFEHGVDVSIQAATKYIGGHSDLMMGTITARGAVLERLLKGVFQVATASGPDESYLALRGLRTLATRLPRHWQSGIIVAEWLRARPEVMEVWHPALPSSPDHAAWQRQFKGASGLFGFVLRPCPRPALAAMLDHLELFGMGASWGGYESLLIPTELPAGRTAAPAVLGRTMRMHVGLEDPADLIRDLEAGFERMARAA